MEQKNSGKFRLRLNLFDCIVIALALLVGGVLLLSRMQGAENSAEVPESERIRYTICLKKTVDGTSELIKVGDPLVDNQKNNDLGEITQVRVENATAVILDQVNGTYNKAEIPGYTDIYVTMESTATIQEDQILVGSGHVLRVGEAIYVKGPGYTASGSVYAIERGE